MVQYLLLITYNNNLNSQYIITCFVGPDLITYRDLLDWATLSLVSLEPMVTFTMFSSQTEEEKTCGMFCGVYVRASEQGLSWLVNSSNKRTTNS